jgi:hypothetical protein
MPEKSSPIHIIPKDQALQAEIDEFGELQREIDLMSPKVERHSILKERLQKRLADAGAAGDKPVIIAGHDYEVHGTAQRNERTFTNKRKAFNLLKARLGLDGVIALITLPLSEGIDKNTTADEQKQFLVENRSGSRTLKVVALRGPAAA